MLVMYSAPLSAQQPRIIWSFCRAVEFCSKEKSEYLSVGVSDQSGIIVGTWKLTYIHTSIAALRRHSCDLGKNVWNLGYSGSKLGGERKYCELLSPGRTSKCWTSAGNGRSRVFSWNPIRGHHQTHELQGEWGLSSSKFISFGLLVTFFLRGGLQKPWA